MAEPEPDRSISNGTCFYAPRLEASSNFIPCGNWVFGDIHCCQKGDFCLEDKACYNSKHGTTYLAGCTRWDYEDPSCPDKASYSDYPWAGLIYCKPNRWVACEETARPTTITKGDECTCASNSESMTVAFSEASSIPPIAILPNAIGGTTEWQPGHFPTGDPSSSSTTTTSATTESSSTTTSSLGLALPTPTSTLSSDPSPQGHNLSDGAKAGIGIGAGVGGILLLGALSALWLVLRRRKHDRNNSALHPETGQAAATPGQSDKPSGPVQGLSLAEMSTPEVPPRPAFSELPVGPRVVRPELHGDGVATHAGSGCVPLPVSPMSSSWYSADPSSGAGTAPLSPVEEEMPHQVQSQGHGIGEGPQGPAVALELAA